MLTGKRAFEGANTASVMAAILEREPPSVPEVVPPALDWALRRCLAKDPEERWQSARDLRAALERVSDSGTEVTSELRPGHSQRRWRAVTVVATLAAVAVSAIHFREKPPETPVTRLSIEPPERNRFDHARQTIQIGSLDSPGEDRTLLGSADSSAMYAQGHLLFLRGNTLVARPFDAKRLAFTGEEVPVAEHLLTRGIPLQSWVFSVSANGVLAYQSGGVSARHLTWLDRAGKPLGTAGDPGALGVVQFSPDRRTAAVNADGDIWLYDVWRGLRTRFTFDPAPDLSPVWSPDGLVIVFGSNRTERFDLYRKPADGSRNEELLYADNLLKGPTSFPPDGAYLAYGVSGDPKTGDDIWILPDPLGAPGASKPYPFLRTEFNEQAPQFSPDGHWIAYRSNESGRYEVYVAPFPGPGGKRQVSTAGGSTAGGALPRWRADGKELFYRAADNRLMAAEVDAKGGAFAVKSPKLPWSVSANDNAVLAEELAAG